MEDGRIFVVAGKGDRSTHSLGKAVWKSLASARGINNDHPIGGGREEGGVHSQHKFSIEVGGGGAKEQRSNSIYCT